MNNFFENVPYEAAHELEQLSRLAFELREQAKHLLQPYGAATAEALFERVRAGELPIHPAAEHAQSALALQEARAAVREQLMAAMRELGG